MKMNGLHLRSESNTHKKRHPDKEHKGPVEDSKKRKMNMVDIVTAQDDPKQKQEWMVVTVKDYRNCSG